MNTVLRSSVIAETSVRRAWAKMAAHLPQRNDDGEGVISLAIAVLIMAVIGAAMFLVFQGIATDSGETAKTKVSSIK